MMTTVDMESGLNLLRLYC